MNRIYSILLLLIVPLSCYAGDGDKFLSLGGGALWKNASSFELNFEREIANHGGMELGLDFYNQNGNTDGTGVKINTYSVLVQAAYKQVLIRFKNANLRWRLAAGVGINERDQFACSITPGLEYNYTFASGVQFFIAEKNQFSFWTSNKSWLRIGGMMGIKIPF
jgi:hypothetical protein